MVLTTTVAGHPVPLEGLDHPARRVDLQPLDHQLVAAAPALGDELRVGHRPPDALARGIEDPFDPVRYNRGRARCKLDRRRA